MNVEIITGKIKLIQEKIVFYDLLINEKPLEKINIISKKKLIEAIKIKKNYLDRVMFYFNNNKTNGNCSLFYFENIIAFSIFNFEINFTFNKDSLVVFYYLKNNSFVVNDEIAFKECKDKYYIDHKENKNILIKLHQLIHHIKNGERKYQFDFILLDKFDKEIYIKVIGKIIKNNVIRIAFINNTKQMIMMKKEALNEKILLLSELCGGLAHEFNNHLMIVKGKIDLIERRYNVDSLYLDGINKAITDMNLLIKRLVTFSKTEHLAMESIKINKIIDDVIRKVKLYNQNVRVIGKTLESDVRIKGNSTLIETSLLNFIKKSIISLNNDGIIIINTSNVILTKEPQNSILNEFQPGSYFKLEIIDPNKGVMPHEKNRLFDPYFKLEGNEYIGGLELSVVLGMAIKHHAIITLSSKVNVGTKYELFFKTGEYMEQIAFDFKAEKKLIMVIDDEDLIREILRDIINELGYDVVTFKDGIEAINFYRKNRNDISLVLCDMIMPSINGKEVFIKLYEIEPSIKFLLLSGYSNVLLNDDLFNKMCGFISKPISMNLLEEKITSIINQ